MREVKLWAGGGPRSWTVCGQRLRESGFEGADGAE